ncbi:Phosphatidylinositol-4-phosphate-5-kinase, partial [Globisporangium splendens]
MLFFIPAFYLQSLHIKQIVQENNLQPATPEPQRKHNRMPSDSMAAHVAQLPALTLSAMVNPYVRDHGVLQFEARARSFPLRSPRADKTSSNSSSPNTKPMTTTAASQTISTKPAQFALALEHINQSDFAPELLDHQRQPSLTSSTAIVTSTTNITTIEPIREMPVSDPESPAYIALVKANEMRPNPPSLLDKRMRIGNAKLGRTKYKNADRSFKKPAGNEIHNQHEQYALTYGMMCGILNSAGLQNPFKQRLTMDDFMRVEKRSFLASAKLQHPFKFKDYAPDIFRQIRRRFYIDSADYMVTLCGEFNFIEFMSNSKSGQFFFYSHDGRFMIKTQTKDESKFLRRILPHYYKFVMENPNTLITRFYGMHRVKMHHLRRKMHFIIMASVFDTPLEIHGRFDLKGSKIGRRATQKERNSNSVLKDMDLLDSGFRLQMGVERRAMLLVQIRKDVEFLKRMKIMDYSMLIGIHDAQQAIHTTILGNLKAADQRAATSKSVPTSPTKTSNDPELSLAGNGIPPVPSQLKRSISDGAAGESSTVSESYAYPCVSNATTATTIASPIDDFDPEFFGSESEYESNSSDGSGEFTVDGAQPAISPRDFDVDTFPPTHSESLFCRDEGGIYGRDRFGRKNGFVYFLGVIDILQQYNSRKIAETFFKGLRHNRKQISAVNPNFYGDRFIEFMEKHVVQDDTLAPLPSSARVSAQMQHQQL